MNNTSASLRQKTLTPSEALQKNPALKEALKNEAVKKNHPPNEGVKKTGAAPVALQKNVTPARVDRKDVLSTEARGLMAWAAAAYDKPTTRKWLLAIAGAAIVVIVAYLCFAGPARETNFGLVPVSGRVMSGGQLIHSGTVTFVPDPAKGNASRDLPTGLIDDYGNYEIFTNGKAGASPGWYKVLVFALAEERQPLRRGQFPVMKSLVASRYTDPKQTDLSIEVADTTEPVIHDLNLKK